MANAGAEALIRDHGAAAYWEARRRARDVILPDGTTHQGRTPAHWHRVRADCGKAGRPRGRPRYRDPDADDRRSAAAQEYRRGLGRRGRSSSRALTVQTSAAMTIARPTSPAGALGIGHNSQYIMCTLSYLFCGVLQCATRQLVASMRHDSASICVGRLLQLR